MKLDAKRREYGVIVIGEEPHLAYNRVGLTSFFQHRTVKSLYLNPEEWVCNTILARKQHRLDNFCSTPMFPRAPSTTISILRC